MTISASILRVQRLVGNHSLATEDVVLSALNERHRSLLESHDWYRKKTEIAITGTVDKSAGTIAVTNESTTVNGTSTAFTASDVGRYVKIGSDSDSLYVVRGVNHSGQFTLGDFYGNALGYPGSSASGLSYVMFTRLYSLGRGVAQILSVKGQSAIGEVPESYLDEVDPTRRTTASHPRHFAKGAVDQSTSEEETRIELYPRPSQAVIVTVSIQRAHVDLLPSQNPIVPSGPIEWLAATDMCYMLAARTKENRWLAMADKFNTEGASSLERERTEDNKKFGLAQTTKDVYSGVPLSMTDAAINHDFGDY